MTKNASNNNFLRIADNATRCGVRAHFTFCLMQMNQIKLARDQPHLFLPRIVTMPGATNSSKQAHEFLGATPLRDGMLSQSASFPSSPSSILRSAVTQTPLVPESRPTISDSSPNTRTARSLIRAIFRPKTPTVSARANPFLNASELRQPAVPKAGTSTRFGDTNYGNTTLGSQGSTIGGGSPKKAHWADTSTVRNE